MPGFENPDSRSEQVRTPPEIAADLLADAFSHSEIRGCLVADLGSGTGTLAIGAALAGAGRVVGVESDAAAIKVAAQNSSDLGLEIEWVCAPVDRFSEPVDTVLMNPPFGAQSRGADRPFWDTAFRVAKRSVHAFALADSRNFIVAMAVERAARIRSVQPVDWRLPPTFRHHRRRSVSLPVERWAFEVARPEST